MTKYIANTPVTTVDGYPYTVAKLDADGETVWKVPPDSNNGTQGVPVTRPAVVGDLILQACFTLSEMRTIYRKHDTARQPHLIRRVLNTEDGRLAIHDRDYDWLHSMLERELPERKNKDTGVIYKPLPFKQELWKANTDWFMNLLKEEGEQKSETEFFQDGDDSSEE